MPTNKLPKSDTAVVVNDKGTVVHYVHGRFAEEEARSYMRTSAGLKEMRGAAVITGDKAREALARGRDK